jgi:hypothetical protein
VGDHGVIRPESGDAGYNEKVWVRGGAPGNPPLGPMLADRRPVVYLIR